MPTPTEAPIVVEISDTQDRLRVDTAALAGLAREVLAMEGVGRASISIALVDDPTIHALNRRHLDHDWPTDIITFRLSDEDDPELAAELVISAEMARDTARKAGTDPRDELALYVVHGLLHLCGYDDLDPVAAGAMRRRESEVLAALGLPNTYPFAGDTAEERVGGGSGCSA